MTVQMQVDINGLPGVEAELKRLATRLRNVEPAFRAIGSALEASTQQRFLDESGPNGVAWEAHSEVTEYMRRKKKAKGGRVRESDYSYHVDKLRDSNHLFDSIGSSASGVKLAVGVNRVYARIQQLGGMAGRGRKVKIPARPYLGISPQDERDIVETLRQHVEGKL